MVTNQKESKQGLVDYVVRFASYLPDLLELFGTPSPVARVARHAVRLVPAVRKGAASDGYDAMGDAVKGRFRSILADQQQLGDRCNFLELENTRIKFELADTANQVQRLKAETMALRTEMESLRKRTMYLSLGVLAVFLVELSELALRFVK